MGDFIRGISEFVEAGGFVMPPLVVATFVLWYALGYRFLTLQRGSSRSVRRLVERYRRDSKRKPRGIVDAAVVRGLEIAARYPDRPLRRILDDAFAETREETRQGRVLIFSIVSVAPLAGLLGTVTGMIETFDSLAEMSLFSQTGGIAGGISQALFTTQMGLSIAVPGIIVGRILDRKQGTIEREIEQLKDMLCAKARHVQSSLQLHGGDTDATT